MSFIDRIACPLCNSDMKQQFGRYGVFYTCVSWKYNHCPGKLSGSLKPVGKCKEILEQQTYRSQQRRRISRILE